MLTRSEPLAPEAVLCEMQRVMIVGGPGSGKSTLARRLGERTGLPVFHMDQIHYGPNWTERTPEAKSALTREVHARERWIFEGGHSATYAERIARADTLIWLDVPVWIRLWRVLRRTLRYRGGTRPEMPEGCTESFGAQTLEFVGFILGTNRSARAKLQRIYDAPPAHMAVFRLTSLPEVEAFLNGLPAR